jgi:hypothetical protein
MPRRGGTTVLSVPGSSEITYLPVTKYAGYNDADPTVAMTAWFQAFLDAKAQNATLVVPLGRFQVSAAFNTTATAGTLASSSAAGATITVASTTGLPAAGPFKIILEPNTTSGVSEIVTVTSYAGNVLTLAERVAGSGWEQGKAHGATYTVARSLPIQSGTSVKGIVPMRGEATPCELQVFGSHYFAGFNGTSVNLQGTYFEDVGFWSSENATTTVARAFMFPGSAATFKDSIFNRCAWKWFTQVRLACGRSRVTWCYVNNVFAYNTSGTRLTPTNEGLFHLAGSDNFFEHVYVDTWYQGIPSDQSIVKIDGFAESTVDFLYVTPAPGRPLEVTGYSDGLVLNFLVNGLGEHNTRQSTGVSPASFGTAAARPTPSGGFIASLRGWLYEATDTRVVSRWDGVSAWTNVVDDTNLVAGSPFATRASLTGALATSNPRRWATVSDTTDLSGIRAYYSDGVRWRGPHFESPGVATSPASSYLGADYGVWFHDIRGVVQVNSLSLRSVAQFDTAFPGVVRVENATVQIANLSTWSSGASTPVDLYVNNGTVELGQFARDGVATNPNQTLVGTGRVDLSVGTDAARQIGDSPRWDGSRFINSSPGRHKSGYYVYHENPSSSTVSLTTLGDLRIAPVYTNGNGIQSLTLYEVTVAAAAGGLIRIVVYSDGPDGLPTNLLYQGTVAVDALGRPASLTGLTIPGSATGRHWIGGVAQVATSPTVRCWVNRTFGTAVPALGATGAAPNLTAILATGITGTAPATFPTAGLASSQSMLMIAAQLA